MAHVDIGRAGPQQFRWAGLQEGSSEPGLFPGLVEREMGVGEFRGMEFLHVEARRIINEIPAAARLPFRYTINAYRGCSHACSYCLVGDTPILMGDGAVKALSEVRTGDRVYGTVEQRASRRYVVTDVLAHWRTVKPAYRVVLDDGTALVASGDHRFLSDRGWKHVTGGEHGAGGLALGDSLVGTGRFADPVKHDDDYGWGYLCGFIRGGAHAPVDAEPLRRAGDWLARFGVRAVTTSVDWPERPSRRWRAGLLAGMFDAVGSHSRGVLRFESTDPPVVSQLVAALREFGFEPVLEPPRARSVRLGGGLEERLRFFHTVDPATTRKRSIEGTAVASDARLGVVAIEPLGVDVPMFDMTTGTGDFVADGVVSHNCFARPTHEYLNLDPGREFETKIVVKVNAPERLRAELAPRRWKGEHIAMGTNTDPYQRCEGKYRLTRRIVETLVEYRNPFSVLTKSTLVLRDLDLLAEAARRTDVSVNLSIGTLDDDVWRLTEPGTPRPAKRIEAVARLNDAGVRSGVMVAPIIPGLSDRPDQLEAVVRAALGAGAHTVSPIVLHLRPGVRELFLPWLEEHRPDLVDRYVELYRRGSYAPKRLQEAIGAQVRALVERFGGASTDPVGARFPRGRRPVVDDDGGASAGEQLRLLG